MAGRLHDLFGPGSNPSGRIVRDYERLKEIVHICRKLELKIVLTSGTFDLLHVGHSRYLEKAKERGDVLIVGVDSDQKTKSRKGPHRPVVPEDERMEILCHVRHVDLVFLKNEGDEHRQLVKSVRPDTLILSKDSARTEADLLALREFCAEVVVLEPQATTSTTARIRLLIVNFANEIKAKLENILAEFSHFLDKLTGGPNG